MVDEQRGKSRADFSFEVRTGEAWGDELDLIRGPIRIRQIENMEFPLWDSDEYLGDDYPWFERTLSLSSALYERLANWQHELNVGRMSKAERHEHRLKGRDLRDRLEREVDGRFAVVLCE